MAAEEFFMARVANRWAYKGSANTQRHIHGAFPIAGLGLYATDEHSAAAATRPTAPTAISTAATAEFGCEVRRPTRLALVALVALGPVHVGAPEITDRCKMQVAR